MTKNELRTKYKTIRDNIGFREKKDRSIFSQAVQLLAPYRSVFIYVSFGSEADTHELIASLFESGKKVLVPCTNNGVMSVRTLDKLPESFITDKFGNLFGAECFPIFCGSAECAVVPLLAFDKHLCRLGYGGGYYDKFLENFGGEKIGLAYDEQFSDDVARESHDVGLDKIVTPAGLISGGV